MQFGDCENLNFIFEGAVNDTSSVETLQHSMYMTGKITTYIGSGSRVKLAHKLPYFSAGHV